MPSECCFRLQSAALLAIVLWVPVACERSWADLHLERSSKSTLLDVEDDELQGEKPPQGSIAYSALHARTEAFLKASRNYQVAVKGPLMDATDVYLQEKERYARFAHYLDQGERQQHKLIHMMRSSLRKRHGRKMQDFQKALEAEKGEKTDKGEDESEDEDEDEDEDSDASEESQEGSEAPSAREDASTEESKGSHEAEDKEPEKDATEKSNDSSNEDKKPEKDAAEKSNDSSNEDKEPQKDAAEKSNDSSNEDKEPEKDAAEKSNDSSNEDKEPRKDAAEKSNDSSNEDKEPEKDAAEKSNDSSNEDKEPEKDAAEKSNDSSNEDHEEPPSEQNKESKGGETSPQGCDARKKAKRGTEDWCRCNTNAELIKSRQPCEDSGGGRIDVCVWSSERRSCVPRKRGKPWK